MAILRSDNRVLVKDQPYTFTTGNIASLGTTIPVVDYNDFNADEYWLVGEIGSETSEIVRVKTVGTDIEIYSGLRNAHPSDTRMTKVS